MNFQNTKPGTLFKIAFDCNVGIMEQLWPANKNDIVMFLEYCVTGGIRFLYNNHICRTPEYYLKDINDI